MPLLYISLRRIVESSENTASKESAIDIIVLHMYYNTLIICYGAANVFMFDTHYSRFAMRRLR